MRLPIPILGDNGSKFMMAEIKRPPSGLVADTKKLIDSNPNIFVATRHFISGIITSIDEVEDSIALKGLIKNIPYRSAEYLLLQSFLLRNPEDDGIEGVYPCPRCHHKIIAEIYEKDEITYDTRDFISKLEIHYTEETSFSVTFDEPVELKDGRTGEILQTINSITMKYPTLEHCIMGYNACMDKRDDIRLQFNIYAQALTHINDEPISQKFKMNFGALMFDKIDNDADLLKISNAVRASGLDNRVEKYCPECGKKWMATINTNNFFVSSLNVSM